MITQEEFIKRMNEQQTVFATLEEQVQHQLEVAQYYLTNMTNIQIITNNNGAQNVFNTNRIIINEPNLDNKETLFLFGQAYISILNQFRPAHMLEVKMEEENEKV